MSLIAANEGESVSSFFSINVNNVYADTSVDSIAGEYELRL